MVADINTDMFLPIFPLKVLTVYGLAESDLGDMVRQVAEQRGSSSAARSRAAAQCLHPQRSVQLHPAGNSCRGDEGGLHAGLAGGGDREEVADGAISRAVGRLNQPVDLAAAGKFEDIVQALTVKVANDPQRPQWKSDSFFRRFTAESSAGQ